MCGLDKGVCFGSKVEHTVPTTSARSTFAQRQLRAAKATNANKGADEAKARQDLERQHAQEIKKLKEELAEARKPSATTAVAAMEVERDGADSAELDTAISKARDKLRKVKEIPEEVRDFVAGGYDACVSKLQDELAQAQAARRAANPLKQRLESAELHKTRMEKRLAEAKASVQRREADLVELNRLIDADKAAVVEAESAAAKAGAEVASLAAQFASERSAMSSALAESAPERVPAGCISVSFAEEKWAEREAEFQQQVAQLQALVASQAEGAAGSEATPSEVGDISSVEQLEEDEVWNKVDRGKRKAILRRERDVLASKVRNGLGKVRTSTCPFKR